MKKLFFLWLLLVSSHLTFGQKSLTLMQADSLLRKALYLAYDRSQVKDSVAIYQFYIRLDLDGISHQLKEVRFSNPDIGAQMLPNLKDSLNKHFDFGVFLDRKEPITTLLVPVYIAMVAYNGYEGDYKIDIKNFHPSEFSASKNRLLEGLKGNYYVSIIGFNYRINRMIYY